MVWKIRQEEELPSFHIVFEMRKKKYISCDLQIADGTVKLLLQTGDSDPQILFDEDSSYSDTIELPAASNYIVIESENFTGTVNLTIK